jgi:hypothetical protein
MATAAALGKQRAEAVRRIEQACKALGGGEALVLPMFSHYGTDTLLVKQLEAIADYIEEVPSAPPLVAADEAAESEGV